VSRPGSRKQELPSPEKLVSAIEQALPNMLQTRLPAGSSSLPRIFLVVVGHRPLRHVTRHTLPSFQAIREAKALSKNRG